MASPTTVHSAPGLRVGSTNRSFGSSLAGLFRWSAKLWNSKWKWTNNAGDPVVTAASDNLIGTRGTITMADEPLEVDPRMLALAGLYVNSYFVEAGTLLIAIFFIWLL